MVTLYRVDFLNKSSTPARVNLLIFTCLLLVWLLPVCQGGFTGHVPVHRDQCIPWTKSLGPMDLGPVQVIFSWTKWGAFLGPLSVGLGISVCYYVCVP